MKMAVQRDVLKLYGEAIIYGTMTIIPATFLAVFALRLGAPNQAIGFLTALPALVNALWLIPAAGLIERRGRWRAPLIGASLLYGLQYALIALLPFLPASYQTPALLAIVTLGAMPAGVYGVLINTLLAGTLASQDRVRVLGNRSLLATGAQALITFLGGWFLGLFALPVNYQLLFLIVFALSIANTVVLRALPVPRPQPGAPASAPVRLSIARLRQLTVEGEAGPFVGFLVAAFVVLFSGSLPRALFSVYWVRVLNASDWWVGTINGLYSLAAVIGYPVWARIAGRWTGRKLLLVGAFGFALYPILTVLAPSAAFLLFPALIGGFLSPPYALGLLHGLFDSIPQSHRPTYIAIYTAASNLAQFVAPILSTSVLLPLIGIHASLVMGAVARIFGGICVYLLVKQPAAESSST